jgi:leader peptidase (prepilin peptidase) / N-methyltransferase
VNGVLVAGCAAGGVVIGGFLDSVTGRIVRPAPTAPDPSADAPEGVPAPSEAVGPLTQVAVETRTPGSSELAISAVTTGVVFALLAIRLGAVPALAAFCSLLAGLVAVSIVDIRLGIVPRSILYPTLATMTVGLVAASAVDSRWRSLGEAAIGGAVAFAVFFALWWFFPRGLGYGDVRLAGVMGAALGWIGFGEIYVGFVAAFVAGTVVGLVLMARQGTGRKTRFAFGPALTLGAAFGVLWGPWAVHLWLHHR